jgi:hypothetical protein
LASCRVWTITPRDLSVAYEPLLQAFLAGISTTSEARASSQHHIRKVEDKNMPREFAPPTR